MKITVGKASGPRELAWNDVPVGAVVAYRNTYSNDTESKYWLKTSNSDGVKLDSGSQSRGETMNQPHYRYTLVEAELVITP